MAAQKERSVYAGRNRIDLAAVGQHVIGYGVVVVLQWLGGMKFTNYEAQGIKALVENSPLMRWSYRLLSVQECSNLIGVTEVLVGLLIAARPFTARLVVGGSSLAVVMFLATLSFIATTPGVFEASAGGVPSLSVVPG